MSINKYKEYLNITGDISSEVFLNEKNIFSFIKDSPPEDIIHLYSEMHTVIDDDIGNDIFIKFYNSNPSFFREFYYLMFLSVQNKLDYFNKLDFTNFINQVYFHLPDIYQKNKENFFKNNIKIDFIYDNILKDYLSNIKRKDKIIKSILENDGHIHIFRSGDLDNIKKFINMVERIENITDIDVFGEMKKNKYKEIFNCTGTNYIELFGFMLTLPDFKEYCFFSCENEKKESSLYIEKYFDFVIERMTKNNIPLKKLISNLKPYRFISLDGDIINKMIGISSTDKENYVIPEILKKLESTGNEGLEKYNEIVNKVIEDEKIKITSQIKNGLINEKKNIKRL